MVNEGHADGIKKTIEEVIGVDTVLKTKRLTEDDIQREKFEKIIRSLEQIEVRSILLGADLGLDLTKYDEHFYIVIDNLLDLYFGKEINELIFFYLYERINPDGSANQIKDVEGKIVQLNSVSDLWELVKFIQNKPRSKKKNARS